MVDMDLQATPREVTGKKVKAFRREGRLPAILYGRGREPTPVWLDSKEASKVLSGTTSSSLLSIMLDGEQLPTLVREKQRDVLLGTLIHVDFQVVSLTEAVRASVSIQLEGFSPAVRENNAILVTGIEEVEVECLPQDLPSHIEVDVSGLVEVGDAIYVRDLLIPEKVEVLSEEDELVVLVTWLAPEELVEEEEEEILEELEEPEVIERGKREEGEEEEE